MIAQLVGKLVSKNKNSLILDVRGVGYELRISLATFAELPAVDSELKILTYQHFKDPGVELFGFASESEKQLFLLLIDVSGIGSRTALEVLSNMSLAGFKRAVMEKDIRMISSIPGIGKKTAEKLIFELKDKIKEFQAPDERVYVSSSLIDEAVDAMKSLGFTYMQAKDAVEKALTLTSDKATAQDILREALKIMGK